LKKIIVALDFDLFPLGTEADLCAMKRVLLKLEIVGLVGDFEEEFNMSTRDTMTPLLSTPWVDTSGNTLAVRALPGLRPELIKTLNATYPGIINRTMQELLATCSGLSDTELGHIDFTGCCFPEEPCSVFQPCLTMATDDVGRRWIAEVGNQDLPGPVWCVFPDPQVAVHVSDDLHTFLDLLREHAVRGQTLAWLQDLSATANAVWAHRRSLALRPYRSRHLAQEFRAWLSSLPADAYVYDLRRPCSARGWPYGVAGPSARQYRCGRLPIFAVAGSPTEGWRAGLPETTAPVLPLAAQSLQIELPNMPTGRRPPRFQPMKPSRWRSLVESPLRCARRRVRIGPVNDAQLRPCA
jgi:hypothetical protein